MAVACVPGALISAAEQAQHLNISSYKMARSIALVALLLAAGIAVASAQAPISTFVNLSPSVLPASPMAGDTIVVMGNLTCASDCCSLLIALDML